MSDHFAPLGFTVDSGDDFQQLALQALRHGQEVGNPGQGWRTIRWDLEGGPSIWLQVSAGDTIECMTPTLSTLSSTRLFVTSYFEAPDCAHCAGLVLENREGIDDGEPLYSLAVQAPNVVELRRTLPAGASHEVRLSAIAEDVRVHRGEPSTGPHAFLATGLVGVDPRRQPIESTALLESVVVSVDRRTNPATGRPWIHARLRTFGLEFDAALAPSAAPEGIDVGDRVHGTFWFAGWIDPGRSGQRQRPSAWSSLLRTGEE